MFNDLLLKKCIVQFEVLEFLFKRGRIHTKEKFRVH